MRWMTSDAASSETATTAPIDVNVEPLGSDWDDAFAWSYGRRVWNVGCG
jgi:hypothetical protein